MTTHQRHIFGKDLRYLRAEIALVAAAAFLYALQDPGLPAGFMVGVEPALLDPRWTRGLFVAAGIFLIARLVHADPVVGDSPFWVTRPYRWTDLLVAKSVFIVAFVNVPFLIAQTVVLLRADFRILEVAPGALFSFLLSIAVVSIPTAAFALLTAGLGPFLIWGTLLGCTVAMMASDVPGPLPPDVEWLRNSLIATTLILGSTLALVLQYRTRQTTRNRLIATLVVASGISVSMYFPYTVVMDIVYRSETPAVAASEHVPEVVSGTAEFDRFGGLEFRISIPRPGDDVRLVWDWARLEVTGSDGPALFETGPGRGFADTGSDPNAFTGEIRLPQEIVLLAGAGPLTVRGRIYFRVFDQQQEARTALRAGDWLDVGNRVRCSGDGWIVCKSPFRSPPELLVVERTPHLLLGGGGRFSPYPAGIDPMASWYDVSGFDVSTSVFRESGFVPSFAPGSEVDVTFFEPRARLFRDFEFTVDPGEPSGEFGR